VDDADFDYDPSADWTLATEDGEDKFEEADHYTDEAGAAYKLNFTGDRVAVYGKLADHHGTESV
jgi:hypothetical protein